MNKVFEHYMNILCIMAGASAIIYTLPGFDGPLITWALRVVGVFFILDGIFLPKEVSTERG